MAYATPTQFRQAFGDAESTQLATRGTGEAADVVISGFLSRASLEIDTRLAALYATPVVGTCTPLQVACMDVARYRMFDDNPSDVARTRYEDVLRWLTDIVAGRAVLLLDSGVAAAGRDPATQAAPSAISVVPRTLTFGESFAGRYAPDLIP